MNDRPGDDLPVLVAAAGEDDAGAWTDYVLTADLDGHFHAFAWRDVIRRAMRQRPRYLIARRQDVVTGVLPLFDVQSRLFGRSLISLPFLNGGGVVADDAQSADALLRHAGDLAREGGYRYGELRQRRPLTLGGNLACRQHKVAMRLPLGDDPDALFQSFRGKLRSQIRRPAKAGAVAAIINGANVVVRDLDEFYAVFAENMRDLGTPVFPKPLFAETIAGFGEQAWLAIVRMAGRPAAAGLMVGFNGSIEMIWASSLRSFNRLSVNMLLYWACMKTALEHGYRSFDFGRSSPDAPTYRFKAQWGAVPLPLPWYYLAGSGTIPDVSPDNPRFRLAVRAWQRLPVPVANRIGPMVARGLP